MSTLNLNSETASFTTRNNPFRRVDARGALAFERDGAAFRLSTPPREAVRVFQLTKAPEFFAFARDATQTLYEPALSAEAAPVFTAFSDVSLGRATPTRRECLRRTADLTETVRKRVYDPTFLERLNVSQPLSSKDLTLANYAPYRIGDRLNAFWNRTSGRWELVAPRELNVVRFQLTAALTSGSAAPAAALYFAQETQNFVDGGLKIVVADFLGRFQGAIGTRGYARRFADRDAWEILALDA